MCRYDVYVTSPAGDVKAINLYSKHQPVQLVTVREVKKKAMKAFDSRSYLGDFKLVVKGKSLDDDSASVSECNIQPKTMLLMVTKVNGG